MHKLTLIALIFGLLDVIKCDWWENVLIYEISTKSFKDSDGDGIGDINGITSKLDYIADLGVDAIWLPEIYVTSGENTGQGYGVTDHMNLNPNLGKLVDFQKFVTKAHEKGLKILLDLVPVFTSKDHLWFLKSVQNETIYGDYYIWANPKGFDENKKAIPPELLGSFKYESSWKFNIMSGQFYYGKRYPDFPKLNLRNPVVVEEMKKILRFWLEIGVDGFYVKDPLSLIDERPKDENALTGSHKVLHKFRELLDEYKETDGTTRLLIAEEMHYQYYLNSYYDRSNYTIVHFSFDRQHLMSHYSGFVEAGNIKNNIDRMLNATPSGKVPAWASETHLKTRIASDWGLEYISMAAVQTLLLPGVASLYYGQEIGLSCMDSTFSSFFASYVKNEFIIGINHGTDANSPMQWDDTENAGFTNSTTGPWNDIRPEYWKFNVEEQKRRKDSYYNFFKELIKLRKTDTCKYGDVNTYVLSKYIFAFTRSYSEKNEMYVAVFNWDFKTKYVELNDLLPISIKTLIVLIESPNSILKTGDITKENENGKLVVEMRPLSVTVFTTTSSTQ